MATSILWGLWSKDETAEEAIDYKKDELDYYRERDNKNRQFYSEVLDENLEKILAGFFILLILTTFLKFKLKSKK